MIFSINGRLLKNERVFPHWILDRAGYQQAVAYTYNGHLSIGCAQNQRVVAYTYPVAKYPLELPVEEDPSTCG